MEINWDRLDKTKFYVAGAGIFTGITVASYPVFVIKTRMQVASKDIVDTKASSIIRNVLKTIKVAGVFVVEPFNFYQPTQAVIVDGFSGMFASLLSQCISASLFSGLFL